MRKTFLLFAHVTHLLVCAKDSCCCLRKTLILFAQRTLVACARHSSSCLLLAEDTRLVCGRDSNWVSSAHEMKVHWTLAREAGWHTESDVECNTHWKWYAMYNTLKVIWNATHTESDMDCKTWNTLQRTPTHCNAQLHIATHCTALQRTATHCNSLHRIATHQYLQHCCLWSQSWLIWIWSWILLEDARACLACFIVTPSDLWHDSRLEISSPTVISLSLKTKFALCATHYNIL